MVGAIHTKNGLTPCFHCRPTGCSNGACKHCPVMLLWVTHLTPFNGKSACKEKHPIQHRPFFARIEHWHLRALLCYSWCSLLVCINFGCILLYMQQFYSCNLNYLNSQAPLLRKLVLYKYLWALRENHQFQSNSSTNNQLPKLKKKCSPKLLLSSLPWHLQAPCHSTLHLSSTLPPSTQHP